MLFPAEKLPNCSLRSWFMRGTFQVEANDGFGELL